MIPNMNPRQIQIPILLVVFLVAIAIINGLAEVNHWYWIYRWFDMPMHFAGGAWLAGFGVWWQYSRQGLVPGIFFAILGVCILFALSIGLLWEAFEAVVSFATVGHMNDIFDTISDVLFDILGGTLVAILIFLKNKFKTT